MLLLDVACLPASCRRWDGTAFVPVDREHADIVDGPALFALRNTRRFAPIFFGYRYFSLRPSKFLRSEISTVESLLPRLFNAFELGQLIDSACWPEIEDFLILMQDRRTYFDPESAVFFATDTSVQPRSVSTRFSTSAAPTQARGGITR